MALLNVFWTQTAINQRNLVFKYWNSRNKSNSYSVKLNFEIKRRIALLKSNPEMGRKTDFNNVKVVVMGHYSILYKIENSNILIVSFWDNRQNPDKLLQLLRDNK